MKRDPDYVFWLAFHRALIAMAKVIETHKLKPPPRPKLQRSRRGREYQRVSATQLLEAVERQ
jgi:hypothetical protein